MKSELRQFLDHAEQLGFEFVEYAGNNHVRLRNDKGVEYTAAATPSDNRNRRNALADLERLSGRKLPRQKSGKFRHHRQRVTTLERTDHEQECCDEAEALIQEAESLRMAFAELMKRGLSSYTDGVHARKMFSRYEYIRKTLADSYRVIPPIERLRVDET